MGLIIRNGICYSLFFLSVHRLAVETPEVMNTTVRVISLLYEYALEYHLLKWFPSRSVNNAESLVRVLPRTRPCAICAQK